MLGAMGINYEGFIVPKSNIPEEFKGNICVAILRDSRGYFHWIRSGLVELKKDRLVFDIVKDGIRLM